MRNISLLLAAALVSLPLSAELSVQNIEKMVKEIKAKRASKMPKESNITSPFISVRHEENSTVEVIVPAKAVKTSFVLGAIVNQSAFIDGAWYKVGDNVGDFRLEKITEDHVVLKRKNRTITLFFRPTKHILTTSKE